MSIKKNFIYNASYQLLLIVLPLITTPYISRVIGVEGIGIYSYSYSIANYFVIFAMLGINNYGNRSIARVRDNREILNKTFSSILLFHCIISSIAIMGYILFISLCDESNKLIFIIQILYTISALFDINWFFFGIEEFKLTVIRNTIIKLISVISIFIFVKNSDDLWIYTTILAASTLLSQISLWPFLKRYVSFTKVSIKDVFMHLKPCSILFVPVLAISVYKIMDKIMLGYMSDMIQVGLYENSEKLISIPLGLITALGTVMLPKMANIISKGQSNESEMYITKSMQFVMFIAIGSTFGLMGIADIIVPIFLGEEFVGSIQVINVIAPTILFLAWANVIRTQYLIPNKRDKVFLRSTIIGAIVNLILNILLIFKFGAIGAAIGTLFAEISVAIYQTIKIRNELNIRKYFNNMLVYILPAIIMYIILKVIGRICGIHIYTILLQLLLGGGVYIIMTLIIMLMKKDMIIMELFKKINL